MTHDSIVRACREAGLTTTQTPASDRRAYSATNAALPGVRVYWTTSYQGFILGLPRVAKDGVDTHARTCREIKYLVTR